MIENYLDAIRRAEAEGLLGNYDNSILTGFSGTKLVGTLQRLAQCCTVMKNACYVEIGVFQGLTLLSVAAANSKFPCFGIDNFAYFDRDGKNFGIVEKRRAFLQIDNAEVINLDYEDALESLERHIKGRKVGVLFVDGPHDYRSQLMCLQLALPSLHDHAVIVVDDCNYRHVRQANRDFLLTHPDFALLFEAYTPRHPSNMSQADAAEARAGWWNGVNILVHDPERVLVRSYPPTFRSRTLYENEHYVHATDIAEHVAESIRVAQMLDRHDWPGLVRAVRTLLKSLRSTRADRARLYRSLNTYSEDLPNSRYADMARSVGAKNPDARARHE